VHGTHASHEACGCVYIRSAYSASNALRARTDDTNRPTGCILVLPFVLNEAAIRAVPVRLSVPQCARVPQSKIKKKTLKCVEKQKLVEMCECKRSATHG